MAISLSLLNVNMDMIMKNVKYAELNTNIERAFLKSLKII